MTTVYNVSIAAYLAALLFAAIALFSSRRVVTLIALLCMTAGTIVQTVYIAMRWFEAGRAPFSNMFESLVLFVWAIMVTYLVVRRRLNLPVLDVAAAVMAVATYAAASSFENEIRPLVPALQSNWLTFHVVTCFLGYAGFAVSFLVSIVYLVGLGTGKLKERTCETLDTVSTKTVCFGFLFLSIGIITGSIWANSAWGTYWSWDPKETWSLITWLIYAIFLHYRFIRGWTGRRMAWISIIGFASVLFTYFGVNLLLSGQHSYA